ncbi:toxin-antitoxin system YwqK family antitoxin [Ralstonia flatus]|uniref:Lipoprotein n=1 Tax=Ralstonia flatus TaxID=3058601 RepID=A0ABN9KGA3_9RALS|nr:hypothetical protein [Ralstonia sp. LMG 32965]MBN6209416.1 hypothetical protein [Ralstonia pickettii]CAJ0893728.1 hypothetical protein R77564_03736 [Ralstonia sp. LMG 32965]
MNTTLYSARRALALCTLATGALLLSACGNRTLDYRNAEIVNGKVYAKGANSPFSGKVTNVPLMTATSNQTGFNKIFRLLGLYFPVTPIGSMGLTSLCEVPVNDGLPDGKVTCKQRESDIVRAKFSFSNGTLDGSFKLNAPTGDDVFAEVDFKDGQPNSKLRLYTLDTHKLVHVIPWENGAMQGTEEGFDPATGKLIAQLDWKDGKMDGVYRKYDGSGNVVEEARYAANKRIDTPPAATNSAGLDAAAAKPTTTDNRNDWPTESNACTERWSTAFTTTHEKDTLVTLDQAWEWVDNCRAGKEPT